VSLIFFKPKSKSMRRIRLDFRRFGDAALLVLAQGNLAALTGNPFFPALTNPTLAEYQTGITAYGTSLSAAQDRGKNNVAAKNARREELINLMVKLALACMQAADGNEEALISTNLPLTRPRGPQQPLGIAVILKVEVGENSGELHVSIAALSGARTLVYQCTQDPLTADSEWISLNSTRAKETLTGLETGKRYWIRVVAYGTNNQMTVSEPVLSRIVQ
jgi:hypothetical protein